jgi:putative phosphoserine phosphatase/1-acylglycerol-3-phosphate O-acyltransferase
MPEIAAIFDLDRTLLLGGSGPILSAGLRRRGVLRNGAPGAERVERLLFGLFDLVGETLPSILLSRQGARAARGWSRSEVLAVGEEVAGELADAVQPFAHQAIERHRARGHRIVLATTTPYDLVEPLGRRLGLDAVLATRYRVDASGRYDGTIDGEFVWARGKVRSVRVWARGAGVELADSTAYSDSFFDLPLLRSVGHPVAVNPDPRLLVIAQAQRWPTLWFNAPPGVPKPVGVEPQAVLARLARPELFPWLDLDIGGEERFPASGGAVIVANHRSYLDPLLIGLVAARAGRPVRFLAKKEVTDAPVVGEIIRTLGVIRVDRGSGDTAPLVEAAAAIRAGELIVVFPQGTIPRGPDFFEPVLVGRPGAGRLVLETGAPVVPIGLWGSELAWPRSNRLPYLLNLSRPPRITIRVGTPFEADSDDPLEVTAGVMERIVDLLPAEAHRHRSFGEAELGRTYPSGPSSAPR